MSKRTHRGRGPAAVLMYHAVSTPHADPFGLSVPPEVFNDQVEMIARDFDVVPAAALNTPSKHARVAITFDDGYVNNFTNAAPKLAALGLPATFFVNTPQASAREFWWDELTHAFANPAPCDFLDLDIGRPIAIDVRTPYAREQAVQKLGVHFEIMHPDAIARVLDDTYRQLGVEPHLCDDHRRLTDDGIKELRALGNFAIGGHTPRHAALTALDTTEARQEIAASFTHLTTLFGTPPQSFAYPFGTLGHSIDEAHARIVEEVGFTQAFTTKHQDIARLFDRFLIPRLNMAPVDAEATHAAITRAMGL